MTMNAAAALLDGHDPERTHDEPHGAEHARLEQHLRADRCAERQHPQQRAQVEDVRRHDA